MSTLKNKHYVRHNEELYIIKGFSDAFEKPQEADICINENGGRHFELNGQCNPTLFDGEVYLYKYENGNVIALTPEEISAARPLPKPKETPIEETLAREIVMLQNKLFDLEKRLSQPTV